MLAVPLSAALAIFACAPFDQKAVLEALVRSDPGLRTQLLIADSDVWGGPSGTESFYLPVPWNPSAPDPGDLALKNGFIVITDPLSVRVGFGNPDGFGRFNMKTVGWEGARESSTQDLLAFRVAALRTDDPYHKYLALLRLSANQGDPARLTILDYDVCGVKMNPVAGYDGCDMEQRAFADLGASAGYSLLSAHFSPPAQPDSDTYVSLTMLARIAGTDPPGYAMLQCRVDRNGIPAPVRDLFGTFPLPFLPSDARQLFAYSYPGSTRGYISFRSPSTGANESRVFWIDPVKGVQSLLLQGVPRIDAVLAGEVLYCAGPGVGRFLDSGGYLLGRVPLGENVMLGEYWDYSDSRLRVFFHTRYAADLQGDSVRRLELKSYAAP